MICFLPVSTDLSDNVPKDVPYASEIAAISEAAVYLSRWFKTSMADTLIKELDTPLFIAHNK